MPIQGINDSTGAVLGQPERDTSKVSKLDFMTLLVAQIQNQDPTSPMDNAEFTSQITQFSMLDELTSMGDKLDQNLMVGQSVNNTAMLALVGKNVTVDGSAVHVVSGQASDNMLNATGPGTASVDVLDANGNVVSHFEAPVVKGLNELDWPAVDQNGEPFPDGQYSLDVSVTNNGMDVPANVLLTGPVEGLRYENNQAVVMVDGHEYYVSEIYKVS